jgi:hypothetical protein
MTGKRPDYRVVVPIDGKDDKTRWREVGAAWVNDGGSISVFLDVVPVTGKIVLFPPKDGEQS